MEQKFKLVDGNVVFVGAMGQANLSNKEIVDMLNGFNKTCENNENIIKILAIGLDAVSSLIDNSDGVAGLHLNGDLAHWDTLRTGGRFEEWLVNFDTAVDSVPFEYWSKM